jgi:hypothetical protein
LEEITNAIVEAYEIGDTLTFIHDDPPANVVMNNTLQSENPKLLETVRKVASCRSGECALDFTTQRGGTR